MPTKQPGLLSAYEPSLREKIAWGMAGLLGGDKYRQQNFAGKVGGLLDFLPGVGEAVGVNDAYRDAKAGNYGQAALGMGLTAVGVVPGVGDAAAGVVKKGMSRIQQRLAELEAMQPLDDAAHAEWLELSRTFDVEQASDNFAEIMKRHGVNPKVNRSGLSESTYFDFDDFRVRGSNHAAKPTYEQLNGAAFAEFGSHDMADGDEIDAAYKVLQRLGIEPDAEVSRTVQERAAKAAAQRETARVEAARRAAYVADPNVIDAMTEAQRRYPQEWAHIQARSANGRKKGLSKLLDQVRTELTAEGQLWR